MLRLHYADGYVVTTDEIGGAVIEYARALAEAQSSAVVTIPIIDSNGDSAQSTLLLGPASQLYTSPTGDGSVEIGDQELVSDLVARTSSLQSVAAVPDDVGSFFDHDDSHQQTG